MAIDETLLESAASESATATVRFYQFEQPTLSLGYRQRLEARDHARLRNLGVSIVRRMTGGRSLLHQNELTYSVTAPTRELFQKRSVKQSYKHIREAIASALRRLGAPIDEHGPSLPSTSLRAPARLPCLAVPTGHEIFSGGRKLVASAQRWRRTGFLQHGAILLRIDRALCALVHELLEGDALGAVGLLDLRYPEIQERCLLSELTKAFEALFHERPIRSGLTVTEAERSQALTEKYRSPSWLATNSTSESGR